MIKYDLTCDNDHHFDSWFANSATFDLQVERRLVTCPSCGSLGVRKAIMAPNVSLKTRSRGETQVSTQGRTDGGGFGGLAGVAVPGAAEPDRASAVAQMPRKGQGGPAVQSGSPEHFARLVEMMREVRRAVEANAANVGSAFAEEARKIHYGEVEERAIFGEAKTNEVVELLEEGIAIMPLPVLPEDQN